MRDVESGHLCQCRLFRLKNKLLANETVLCSQEIFYLCQVSVHIFLEYTNGIYQSTVLYVSADGLPDRVMELRECTMSHEPSPQRYDNCRDKVIFTLPAYLMVVTAIALCGKEVFVECQHFSSRPAFGSYIESQKDLKTIVASERKTSSD